MSAELAATRRRLRVIRDHRIPELGTAIAELDLRLDDQEREDHARVPRECQQGGVTASGSSIRTRGARRSPSPAWAAATPAVPERPMATRVPYAI